VTKAGFEAMSAKMNLDGPDPQNLDDGDEVILFCRGSFNYSSN